MRIRDENSFNYGLGTECRDLPGYVVLNSGRGTSGGASNWSSGFLSSAYAGVVFRNHLKLNVRFSGLDVRLTNLSGKVVHKLIA